MNNDAINDFPTKMVAREVQVAITEHDPKIRWVNLEVGPISDGDAHFTVTNADGRKFRVTITPDDN